MQELKFTESVFVIGSPRSGTSILAWALARHPDFWTSAESDFIRLLFGKNHTRQAYETALQRHGTGWLEQHAVSYEEFARFLGYGIDRLFSSRAGGRRWIDSTPGYTLMGSDLALLFPKARFLHIVRDGRAVVSSMINSGFPVDWSQNFEAACKAWSVFVQKGGQQEREFPERTLQVRHERLVSDPRGLFDEVLAFLGAEPDPGPAELASTRRINSSYGNRRPGDVRRSKDPNDIPREPWVTWDRKMWRTFERIAGPTMAEFGYREAPA